MDINGKRIAVAGVSSDENKYGHRVFRDLIDAGYDVAGINPNDGKILGKKIYKSLTEMEYVPDVVITVVQPAVTEKIVAEAAAKGVKTIWMQPGSESQPAIDLARKHGIAVTYNACIMIANGIW